MATATHLPPPGSFSATETYKTCPHKYYRKYITRDVKDPPGAAAIWGSQVHEALEHAIERGAPMPDNMKQYEKWVKEIEHTSGEATPEIKLGMTKDGQPTDFHALDVWFRGIADVGILHSDEEWSVVDWKTGKPWPGKSRAQSDKMAMLGFIKYPKVQVIHSRFVFLKFDKIESFEYTRADLPELVQATANEQAAIRWSLDNKAWPKQTNGLCRNWCPVEDCEFNGRRK